MVKPLQRDWVKNLIRALSSSKQTRNTWNIVLDFFERIIVKKSSFIRIRIFNEYQR